MITDSHCHLTSDRFEGEIEGLVERAARAGVHRMVTIGCDLEDGPRCVQLAARHEAVHAAVGIHPCYVTELDSSDWLAEIRTLAGRPGVAAIGEIGLDYYHPAPEGWSEEAYRARQAEVFVAQLQLAAELDLNVVVHQRDRSGACWADIQRLISPFHDLLRAVFHCFSGDWEAARPVVERGHLVSFTGIVTFRNATGVQSCAREAPAGSFMLETDAPYLAPVPHRGKRCEPAHAMHTAEFIAQLRGIPLEQLARETEAVAEEFFRFAN